MGDFSEHILFGFLTATLVAFLAKDFLSLSVYESSISVLAVFVGSVIPDIDHKNSYIHRAIKSLVSISAALGAFLLPLQLHQSYIAAIFVFLLVYLGISRIKIRHRGFTHSISFCLIIASIFTVFAVFSLGSYVPGVAFAVGLFSHLILDEEFKLE